MAEFQNGSVEICLGKGIPLPKCTMTIPNNYLKDGRLEISNNLAENCIKTFGID